MGAWVGGGTPATSDILRYILLIYRSAQVVFIYIYIYIYIYIFFLYIYIYIYIYIYKREHRNVNNVLMPLINRVHRLIIRQMHQSTNEWD